MELFLLLEGMLGLSTVSSNEAVAEISPSSSTLSMTLVFLASAIEPFGESLKPEGTSDRTSGIASEEEMLENSSGILGGGISLKGVGGSGILYSQLGVPGHDGVKSAPALS